MDKDYLFHNHPKSVLIKWANAIKYFRYYRAHGGHTIDGDSLVVAFRYESEEELKYILSSFHIELKEIHPDWPKPIPGKSYTHRQFSVFKNEIKNFPNFEQPSLQKISGEKVTIWCESGKMVVRIVCSGNDGYAVTEDDVIRAQKIEKQIEKLEDKIIDPPEDNDHYICPKYYPSLFKV